MKIAICTASSKFGGVGTSTYILASGLRQMGHEADIVVTSYDVGDDYERARRDGWPVKALCPEMLWLRKRSKTTLDELSRYDVVINNHSTETQLVLPALPSTIVRLSVIRTVNDYVISDAHLNSRWLDAVVGISPEVSRLLSESRIPCTVHMIPNACMVTGDKSPILEPSLRLIYLGQVTDFDKNILILPEIARCLLARGCKFILNVVGDGADRAKLQQRARELGVDSSIRFCGAVPRTSVGDHLARSHFAILPSNYEGFGLTLIETMAVGCVPIASNIPSYRWILGEHAATLTVPCKDAEAYARRLCALAADPEHYARLQESLRQRQRENFTPEATVGRYAGLIAELHETLDPKRFRPVPFASLAFPKGHKGGLSGLWYTVQRCLAMTSHLRRKCRRIFSRATER